MSLEIMVNLDLDKLNLHEEFFSEASQLIKEFWWLLDFKWTDTINDGILEKVPEDWANFLHKLTAAQIKDLLLHHTTSFPGIPDSLKNFICRCQRFSLRSLWPEHELTKEIVPRRANKKIKPKKSKEVESLLEIIIRVCEDQLRTSVESTTILDVGAGLGYISEKLSDAGFSVVGIEAQEKLCQTANVRYENDKIQFIQLKLDESDISIDAINKVLPDNANVIAIGLHCCGNLLNTIMHTFKQVEQIKAIVCVTCCYHLIDSDKFPRSATYQRIAKREDLIFTRQVQRVATQDPPLRWAHNLDEAKLEHHLKTAFYRAVMEEVLLHKDVRWTRIVKKNLHCKLNGTFDEFLESVEDGFEESSRASSIQIAKDAFEARSSLKHVVNPLKALQTLIQPVLETIIVLDHIVKLREQGFASTGIQCFSQLVSPRNLCVIASKN